ncbi:glycosyltransferase [Ideonella sp. 4Y16]|uniref:glycosyltransferase n=1 Tax=Ideonella alba TaxID=2824118 RepID=UPI001B372D19|nr:glycosyltransferase [Ideonella alba]MBQ0941966.1 glycosyltransferase [Ideonella alba]
MTTDTHARIALVMIARNEARCLRRAIDSLRPHVDDCLVLDTGSDDATPAIARAAGARVAHFAWVDDFSAARNAALDLAAADWHLVVDADEWLISGAEVLAALRRQRPDFVGQVRVDSQQDGDAGSVPSWISRVLPGPVRYAGRVHEQPQHALPVRRLALQLGHDGYQGEALARKAGRNARLLDQALAADPDDAYLWYQRGKDHDVYGRWAEAVADFDQAARQPGEQAWRHDLAVRRLHAMKCLGRHGQAMQLAEAELARWADSPDFFFALGDLLLDWAAQEPARSGELVPLIEAAWQRCLAIGERPDLEGAVAGRGSHLAERNLRLLHELLG